MILATLKKVSFLSIAISFFFFPAISNAQTAAINLIWEANSYVPPFYAGKAMTTSDGDVDVFALLPESFGDPTRATYTWELNGSVLGGLSGVGRSSLRISGSPFIIDRSVRVTVTGANGKSGFGFVTIPVAKPKLLVYEDSALGGVLFSRAITDSVSAQTDTDIVLSAYPYFFSTNSRTNLPYDWKINGQRSDSTIAELVARSETTGTSTVSVEAHNTQRILERASEMLSIVLQ